jgi:fibronectin type 3 domain-containing protein
LDIDTNNNVVTATPSGSNTQQWNIKNIGGGQYEVSSVAKGNSWYTYAAPLHLLPWGWGPGGNTCFIILPATGGYYRVSDSGGGLPFEPSIGDPPLLDQDVWNGSAAQQWAIVSPSAPAFPCGLSVTASSSTQDLLTWNAVGGAGSYNVKRSLTSGGPYTTIATGVATTNYTDTGLAYGTTYYYVVSATVGGVESLNSLEATVAVPYPWMTQDMGAVDLAGSASFSFSNGVFTLTGSGADIWGTGDQFRFVYMPVTGDCTIVALVASVQNIDPWSKAGIMIRESLATNSTDVLMAVTPGNGVTWQYRSSTGGDTANNNTTGLSAPYWVKLVRSGNTFTGYRSPNGQTWTQLGSATFTMASSAYIGLALTSHNSSSLCTATFCNVTAPGWPPSFILPAPPASLSATSVSASQINLTWNATTNTASYNVKRSTTNGGPYAVVATGVTATNYNDTGLAAASTYYYVVSAVNSGGESTNSAQASATTAVAVPAAPTGLSALATSSSQINLTWNATTNTASYDVKRSATSGGPYTIIATGVTTTNYADTNVTVDVEYYYVVSAVIGGVGSLNSAEASAASLRAYLTFDEYGGTTAWDSTENGWNGTLVNGPIWTTGNFGNAVDLEGVSQYVSLPSGVVSSLTNFTMATWVNLGATSTWARVFDFGSGTTAYMFLAPVSGSGTIRFAITTTASGGEQQINGSAPLPTNAWTHVAVTLSGGTGILYANGVEVGVNTSMTLTPASLGVTTQNYIGKSQYSGDPYLDGLVDEFRIYTDALSAADVAALYAYQPPILPASPASLSATSVSASQINLTWNATTNTASYNVKRSATSGGPYTVIATGMTTTNYSDAGLIIGAQYYYVVSAVVGGVESLNSAQASALPYPWLSQDIGAVGIAGSATYSNGVFAVAGAGADIQNAADAFRFVYVTASGNCTIIARVASMQDIDPWSKAGVMIRASLASNAVNAFVGVTPGNGVTWQDRSSTGGGTSYNNTNGLSAPYWVKLVRSGNTFTGSCSPNGATWTQQGTATLTMASAAYIGLALTSHNSSSLCAATFDNVTAPGWPTSIPPASPASLSATAWDSQVALSWPASSGAISYNVKCATLNGGPYATVTNATTTNYTDNGLINGTNYYYVVSALNIAGESANSAQASATPLKLPQPRIVGVSIVGGSLMFSGTNGLAGGSYTIWSSTNVATPLTNWTQVGSSNFDGNGNFSVTNAINNNETQQFYLLRQP